MGAQTHCTGSTVNVERGMLRIVLVASLIGGVSAVFSVVSFQNRRQACLKAAMSMYPSVLSRLQLDQCVRPWYFPDVGSALLLLYALVVGVGTPWLIWFMMLDHSWLFWRASGSCELARDP